MSDRVSIELDGISHGDMPIPMACRVSNLVFSSAIPGRDPADGKLPEDVGREVELAFGNLAEVLHRAGATPEDVGMVTILVNSDEVRNTVNRCWVQMFPNSASRPARHTVVQELRGGARVQLKFVAVVAGGDGSTEWN